MVVGYGFLDIFFFPRVVHDSGGQMVSLCGFKRYFIKNAPFSKWVILHTHPHTTCYLFLFHSGTLKGRVFCLL